MASKMSRRKNIYMSSLPSTSHSVPQTEMEIIQTDLMQTESLQSGSKVDSMVNQIDELTRQALTVIVTSFLSLYISYIRHASVADQNALASEYARLIADTVALIVELLMTLMFIAALHRKHVLLMKVYLYFEIVYSIFGFIYSLAFLTKETASELFLILFQLMLQIYLVILIWSSIVKMERDGTVKYSRETEDA